MIKEDRFRMVQVGAVTMILIVYCRMLQKDLETRNEVLLERDHGIYKLKQANKVMPAEKSPLVWKHPVD